MQPKIIEFHLEKAKIYEEFADRLLRLALDIKGTDDVDSIYRRLKSMSDTYRGKEKDLKYRFGGR